MSEDADEVGKDYSAPESGEKRIPEKDGKIDDYNVADVDMSDLDVIDGLLTGEYLEDLEDLGEQGEQGGERKQQPGGDRALQ